MNPLMHRVGAAVVVAIGVAGAFSGLIVDRTTHANAATAVAVGEADRGPRLSADAEALIDRSASAMAAVQRVRFAVERRGAPVYIDTVESIGLETVVGRFAAPGDADAIVTVTVDDTLVTELGAIALGSDIWLSNPITGAFEPLPSSYDFDPSRFFDPTGGWQPLLDGLTDRVLIETGDVYVVRGVAPRTELARVTGGLVQTDDVVVDLWLDPYSALVRRVEFSVSDGDGVESEWRIDLSGYGDSFVIEAPEEVAS